VITLYVDVYIVECMTPRAAVFPEIEVSDGAARAVDHYERFLKLRKNISHVGLDTARP